MTEFQASEIVIALQDLVMAALLMVTALIIGVFLYWINER